jgi:hypothetical protein
MIKDWMYLNKTCWKKDNACVKHRRKEGYKVIHSRITLNFKPNTIYLVSVRNYEHSSHWFESGFTGFIGLTITSLVWGGRLLLNSAFISKPLAAALRSGEKDDKK